MRAPRSVTRRADRHALAHLELAIDLRARRICARWPAIVVSSSIAASSTFESVFASPTPMLSVIFSIARHLHDRVEAELLLRRGRISSSYRVLEARRVCLGCSLSGSLLVDLLAAVVVLQTRTLNRLVLDLRDRADAGRPLQVGQTTITFETGSGAGSSMMPPGIICGPPMRLGSGSGAGAVPLDDVDVLDDDLAAPRERLEDAALLAAVLAAAGPARGRPS